MHRLFKCDCNDHSVEVMWNRDDNEDQLGISEDIHFIIRELHGDDGEHLFDPKLISDAGFGGDELDDFFSFMQEIINKRKVIKDGKM